MIGRRSVLGLIGLGGGVAASGARLNGMGTASNIGASRSLGSTLSGAAGEGIGSSYDWEREEAERSVGEQQAAAWLRANGLPTYVRQRIRDGIEVTADQIPMPDDIKALRSFAPHLKRRLHVERLAKLREREVLADQIHDLTRKVRQSVIPEGVRKFMGWL